MLGIVTIELVLAPATILMKGQVNDGQAVVARNTAATFRAEVNRTNITADTAAVVYGCTDGAGAPPLRSAPSGSAGGNTRRESTSRQ